MHVADEQLAAEAIRKAAGGEWGDAGLMLLRLFRDAAANATETHVHADGYLRQANAMAAVVADILDGAKPDSVVNDLPHDARRRVIAYRHATGGPLRFIKPSDQFGRLPDVPPRESVMRDSVRTVDVDIIDVEPISIEAAETVIEPC